MFATVLIVETDALVGNLMADILKDSGYAVSTAATLASAREQMAADRDEFDVVLLNPDMPDGGGLEFCRSARAAGFTRTIIVVSGNIRELSRAGKYGASSCLLKPFTIIELLKHIDAAVSHDFNAIQSIMSSPCQGPTSLH